MEMVRIVREGHTIQTVPATATREVMEDQTTGIITTARVPAVTTGRAPEITTGRVREITTDKAPEITTDRDPITTVTTTLPVPTTIIRAME
jgi:hypothetical protein